MFSRKLIHLDKDAKELFEMAAHKLRNSSDINKQAVKDSIVGLIDDCKAEDILYSKKALINSLHLLENNKQKGYTSEVVDKLKSLYENHFVKTKSTLRSYYDEIMSSWCITPEFNKCPYCGIGNISELDHFLPESEFGLLVINPKNLIPSCHDCNKIKSSYYSSLPSTNFIHPYFDDTSNYVWLKVTIQIFAKRAIPVFACFNYNNNIPADIFSRICHMFNYLDIGNKKYQAHLSEDLTLLHDSFSKGKYKIMTDEEVLISLQDKREEYELSFGRNHCKTAFYNALSQLSNFNDLR